MSLYSLIILSVSSPVNLCSLMSRMACDCFLDKPKPSIRASLADTGSLLFLIVSTILSIFLRAIFKPSNMCALDSALARSNFVLFTTTSNLKDIKTSRISFKFITFGVPSTSANKIIPKVSCSWVCLYNWFKTTSGTASLFISITIRIPSLSDSSLSSAIPSIFLSLAKYAIFSIRFALLT